MKKRVMKIFTSLFLICATVLLPACARVSVPEKDSEEATTSSEKVECNHVYETLQEKPATCENAGEILKACTDCGKALIETTKPLGHEAVEVPGTSGTCMDTVLSKGSYCNRCGETLKYQIEGEGYHVLGENGICTLCHKGIVEIELSEFEWAVGNWYRIYRSLDHSNSITLIANNGLDSQRIYEFFAGPVGSETENLYLLYNDKRCYLEGLSVVYGKDYIDFHFQGAFYNIYDETGKRMISLNINDDTMISGKGKVYRIAEEYEPLPDTSSFTEVKVQENEKIAGNWYRLYRDDTNLKLVQLSGNDKTLDKISLCITREVENACMFYMDKTVLTSFTPKGWEVIHKEDYIDVYIKKGTYKYSDSDGLEFTMTIDSSTYIKKIGSTKIYRLVENA